MMNHVFILLIVLGLVVGLINAVSEASSADTLEQRLEILKLKGKEMTDTIVKMAETAVKLCLDYIAMMALWLGVMKIADESGLVKSLVALIRPVLVRLFRAFLRIILPWAPCS
jgi:spore maturation protein A